MIGNKMKNKIFYKNIQEDSLKRPSKFLKKKEKSFFFTPHISDYSLLIQNEGTKRLLNKEKPKTEKNLSNLKNYEQIRLQKINPKKKNKSNISLISKNKTYLFNNSISNKRGFKIQNYNTNLKSKNFKHDKIKSFNSTSIIKNPFIDNDKNNKNGNKIKLNNKNTTKPFIQKKKINKVFCKNILKIQIPKKNVSKFDLSKNNKNNIENKNNISFNRNNNKNNNITYNTEKDLSKIIKINEKFESLYKKENNNKCISNQIKINVNMNNSSKLTNISSYVSNLNSKKKTMEFLNKKKDDINKLKNIFLLKLKIDSNESETAEYESQFLNYDLALSNEKTISKNNNLDKNILFSNKEKSVNEYEKSVEELEKLANEICNSQYKKKRRSYIYRIKQNVDINDNTEELKEGEEIKNILSLNINKKNKVKDKK